MMRASPGALARIAGALYLINILAGAFAIGYVPAAVGQDAHANELLFRAGLAAHVLVTMTNVPLALIFYELFKVVDRRLALLAVLFIITANSIEAAGITEQLTAAKPFDVLAASFSVSTVFFGLDILILAYLILRSALVPRAIGVLLAIDGAAYVFNSYATFLSPGFAAHLVPYILLPAPVGEGSLTLWLLLAGINVARWERLNAEAKA
jgi:hypothetical protein